MIEKNILKDIDSYIAENSAQLFQDIADLVAINSVNGPAEEGAPFGTGPAAALQLALNKAKRMGFSVRNCENMIGYASIGFAGEDKPYLATITHLDVVPAGNGWTGDPFVMRDIDGYILGRGVIDDKGPSMLCLYALKYFLDRQLPLKYEIRALLGINEEIGMKDVAYYLANYPAPAFCFSPDAGFPLVNGEKGIFHGRIISRTGLDRIVSISGGVAANAVPDEARAEIRYEGSADALSKCAKIDVCCKDGTVSLTAHGIGGHASMPVGTENAIGILVDYILENSLVSEQEAKYLSFLTKLHSAFDGSGLGVQADDGLFTPLTIIGGVIGVADGHIYQTVDSRYPTNMSGEKLVEIIGAQCTDFADVVCDSDAVPFYMSLDNPAVKVCIDAYNSVTGENAQPFTIGGGTYARDFPNAASFGPEHEDRPMPDFCGFMHGANEAAYKADLLEALKVYIIALLELEKLDF